MLRNLSKSRHAHAHLVRLLATYDQSGYLHLILPWAEVDLDQYWRFKHPQPPRHDAEISAWMKQQCCGLAEGVAQIHRYNTTSATSMMCSMMYDSSLAESRGQNAQTKRQPEGTRTERTGLTLFGRHGDIKPSNILWFPDQGPTHGYGTLKLSDFGTARFSKHETLSERDKLSIPNSRAYESPESRIPGRAISSQCDVWALGCVFLEFVCWYVGGCELLKKFEGERHRASGYEGLSFFHIEVSEGFLAELKQPVIHVSLIPPNSCKQS